MRRLHALIAAALGAAATTTVVAAPAQAGQMPPVFAFTSDRDGDPELYVRLSDGSNIQLTHNRVADFDAVWSPDGSRLAFVRAVGTGTALFVMDADGQNVRRLTTPVPTPEGFTSMDSAPSWSPDGRKIAFASNRAGGETEIFRINTDGTSLVRLTRTEAHVSDHNPTWSADGRTILFDSDRAGYFNREIYRMRSADGSALRRLTRTPDGVDDGAPDVIPGGGRIVFSSTRGNGDQDLWTMRSDGTGARRLGSSEEMRDEVFPQWTRTGDVLYWSFGTPEEPQDTIWRIEGDGTGDRRVTTGRFNDSSPDPYPVRWG